MNREERTASSTAAEIEWLLSLGPEAQGDIDESLLRDNLRLSPMERLEAASRAVDAVEKAAVEQLRRIRELRSKPDGAR